MENKNTFKKLYISGLLMLFLSCHMRVLSAERRQDAAAPQTSVRSSRNEASSRNEVADSQSSAGTNRSASNAQNSNRNQNSSQSSGPSANQRRSATPSTTPAGEQSSDASRPVSIRRAGSLKYTSYKKHFFKIKVGKDYVYTLSSTSLENIQAHRWKKGSKLVEVRAAFDFVHLSWHALREHYTSHTADLYSSVKLLKEGQKNVGGNWIWYAKLKGELKTGGSVSVKLIITKNRNIAYFISVIAPEGETSLDELYKIVNSIKFY